MSSTQDPPRPTRTATVEIRKGHRYEASAPHALGAIALYVGLLVVCLYWMHYIVRRKSGINDPDSVHRIWSRASEIRRQPMKWPLAWAVLVSSGITASFFNVFQESFQLISVYLLKLVGSSFHSMMVPRLVDFLGTWLSGPLSVALYRAGGGSNWKLCALLNLVVSTYEGVHHIFYVYMAFIHDQEKVKLDYDTIRWLSHPASMMVFLVLQSPLCVWAAYKALPQPAQLIYNTTIVPNWVKLDRTIVMATIPLVLYQSVSRFIILRARFPLVARFVFELLIVLVGMSANALAAIVSVNRALLAGEFQWHWRAFFTPAVPAVIAVLVELVTYQRPMIQARAVRFIVWSLVSSTVFAGGGGTLGAYAYIRIAEFRSRSLVESRSE